MVVVVMLLLLCCCLFLFMFDVFEFFFSLAGLSLRISDIGESDCDLDLYTILLEPRKMRREGGLFIFPLVD